MPHAIRRQESQVHDPFAVRRAGRDASAFPKASCLNSSVATFRRQRLGVLLSSNRAITTISPVPHAVGLRTISSLSSKSTLPAPIAGSFIDMKFSSSCRSLPARSMRGDIRSLAGSRLGSASNRFCRSGWLANRLHKSLPLRRLWVVTRRLPSAVTLSGRILIQIVADLKRLSRGIRLKPDLREHSSRFPPAYEKQTRKNRVPMRRHRPAAESENFYRLTLWREHNDGRRLPLFQGPREQ